MEHIHLQTTLGDKVIVIERATRIPVLYRSWSEWRFERLRTGALPPPLLLPRDSCFCALCWGAGRFYEPAPNGEGDVPRTCPACQGSRIQR
jgi:hypothetical protein